MTTAPGLRLSIQRVNRGNIDDYIGMLEGLALFEKLPPPDDDARERLRRELLGQSPMLEAYVAYAEGTAVGILSLFTTYSTFAAKPVLYLEDIFVPEPYRSRGVGRQLMDYCKSLARERGCVRLEWNVLRWNKDAIRFYEELGASPVEEWVWFRLDPQ